MSKHRSMQNENFSSKTFVKDNLFLNGCVCFHCWPNYSNVLIKCRHRFLRCRRFRPNYFAAGRDQPFCRFRTSLEESLRVAAGRAEPVEQRGQRLRKPHHQDYGFVYFLIQFKVIRNIAKLFKKQFIFIFNTFSF